MVTSTSLVSFSFFSSFFFFSYGIGFRRPAPHSTHALTALVIIHVPSVQLSSSRQNEGPFPPNDSQAPSEYEERRGKYVGQVLLSCPIAAFCL
ncbi:hypothetical protein QR685DRAFT_517133 [Neurospora intermedia]|uniref:Secreted protein n=1 Tax=Neurospora intermedia TaxID=5142 RepID=A0ABR3DNR8_NEUIN